MHNKCMGTLIPFILKIMKYITVSVCLLLISCRPRYEVIQPVQENVYHLQGVRNKEVLIILSDIKLKSGEIIRPKKEDLYINKKNIEK